MEPLKTMSVFLVLALSVLLTNARPEFPDRQIRPIHCPAQRPCLALSYDAVYDFQNNVSTSSPYVTVQEGFSLTGCATQGVLKIALASATDDPNRRRVLIDLFFTNPNGWVFNLGDSSTNDGYGGDSNTQTWDAEVQGVTNVLNGYLSDNGGSGPAFHILDLYSTRITLVAGNSYLSWLPDNNDQLNYYYNPGFFALNGQDDSSQPGGTNYDLYFGINRVINNNFRFGTGLCRVAIKFLNEF